MIGKSSQTTTGGLAESADYDDPDVLAALRGRLERMLLQELQTGGGMTLEQISGLPADSRPISPHVAAIRRAVHTLKVLRAGAPQRAARLLCVDGIPNRVLDIGAGLATWSVALASWSDDMHVVALDLPTRIPDLSAAVARSGCSAQFEFAAADVFQDEIDTSVLFDLVIVANVVHLFEARRTQELLSLAATALCPGGRLAVIDQVLDDNPDWLQWAALYAVGAPHWLPGGYLYTMNEYRAWLHEAELTSVHADEVCPPPSLTLITANR